jgi:hypothetical protein
MAWFAGTKKKALAAVCHQCVLQLVLASQLAAEVNLAPLFTLLFSSLDYLYSYAFSKKKQP